MIFNKVLFSYTSGETRRLATIAFTQKKLMRNVRMSNTTSQFGTKNIF